MRCTNNGEFAREQFGFGQVIKCGNELATGQIAAGSKDHHYARIRRPARAVLLCFLKRFCQSHSHYPLIES